MLQSLRRCHSRSLGEERSNAPEKTKPLETLLAGEKIGEPGHRHCALLTTGASGGDADGSEGLLGSSPDESERFSQGTDGLGHSSRGEGRHRRSGEEFVYDLPRRTGPGAPEPCGDGTYRLCHGGRIDGRMHAGDPGPFAAELGGFQGELETRSRFREHTDLSPSRAYLSLEKSEWTASGLNLKQLCQGLLTTAHTRLPATY
jgi:hypothetical protein